MSRVRGTDTKPEIILRKTLWAEGFRYRKNFKLPGKPDLVFTRQKLAVFVDGCFWHGCPIHGETPQTNSKFWKTKIARNKQRDKEVLELLIQSGWKVIRFWEHEIKNDLEGVVGKIKSEWMDK